MLNTPFLIQYFRIFSPGTHTINKYTHTEYEDTDKKKLLYFQLTPATNLLRIYYEKIASHIPCQDKMHSYNVEWNMYVRSKKKLKRKCKKYRKNHIFQATDSHVRTMAKTCGITSYSLCRRGMYTFRKKSTMYRSRSWLCC